MNSPRALSTSLVSSMPTEQPTWYPYTAHSGADVLSTLFQPLPPHASSMVPFLLKPTYVPPTISSSMLCDSPTKIGLIPLPPPHPIARLDYQIPISIQRSFAGTTLRLPAINLAFPTNSTTISDFTTQGGPTRSVFSPIIDPLSPTHARIEHGRTSSSDSLHSTESALVAESEVSGSSPSPSIWTSPLKGSSPSETHDRPNRLQKIWDQLPPRPENHLTAESGRAIKLTLRINHQRRLKADGNRLNVQNVVNLLPIVPTKRLIDYREYAEMIATVITGYSRWVLSRSAYNRGDKTSIYLKYKIPNGSDYRVVVAFCGDKSITIRHCG